MTEIKLKDMSEEQIVDLEAQIAELRKAKERKPLAWKPGFQTEYFGIAPSGAVTIYKNLPSGFIDKMAASGCVFPTEALRDAELERRKILHRIHEWIDENDAERGGRFIVGEWNYLIIYVADEDVFDTWRTTQAICNPLIPCFSSQVKLAQCIKDIGEENIKLLFKHYDIVRGDE